MQTVLNKQQEGVRDGKVHLGDGPVAKNTILHHTTLSVSVTRGGSGRDTALSLSCFGPSLLRNLYL